MGNPVTHWQIISKDPDGAAGFYKELPDGDEMAIIHDSFDITFGLWRKRMSANKGTREAQPSRVVARIGRRKTSEFHR